MLRRVSTLARTIFHGKSNSIGSLTTEFEITSLYLSIAVNLLFDLVAVFANYAVTGSTGASFVATN